VNPLLRALVEGRRVQFIHLTAESISTDQNRDITQLETQ
jgi:hypothetical protein